MKGKLDHDAPTPTPAFNTRRRAVRQWIAHLPLANLSALSRQLHEALRQVNAQRTSTARLFHFLEAVGPAAANVLSHLQRQYAHQPLPLSDANSRAARLAVELLSELLRGYRTVLKTIVPEKEEAARWRTLWYRHELTTTLHRFIHYGNGLIEIYRVLHMDPPEKVWRRIHRCYRLAEVHGLTKRRVPLFGERHHKTALGHEYGRLLLSELLPTDAIPPAQQREIDTTLDRWVALLQLRPVAERSDDMHFLVRLGRDLGPLAIPEVDVGALKSDNTRMLDTRVLCQALAQQRARGGKGRWWRRESSLDPATLTLLHEHWCSTQHRAEMRIAVNLPAQVAVGLGALFHLAGGAVKTDAPAGAVSNSITLEAVPEGGGGNWLGKRSNEDVWGSIYADPKAVKRTPSAPGLPSVKPRSEPEYASIPGRVVDKSEHGLAVVMARSDLRNAAVGMPAAVRTDDEDWRVGTVMRIKDRGDDVELGLRILLQGAVAARLRTRDGARVSPLFDVVIGRTHEGHHAVAAPAVSALRSGEPVLEMAGKMVTVQRGATVTHSRYLDAFVIELQGEALAAMKAAAQAAAAAPRSRAASAGAPADVDAPAAAPTQTALEHRIQDLMTKTGLSRADAEFIVSAEMEAEQASN